MCKKYGEKIGLWSYNNVVIVIYYIFFYLSICKNCSMCANVCSSSFVYLSIFYKSIKYDIFWTILSIKLYILVKIKRGASKRAYVN